MSRRNFLKYLKLAVLGLIILLLIFLLKNIITSIFETNKRAALKTQLTLELEKKKQEQDLLKQKIEIAKSNKFVEEEARTKLGMIKPGEKVVIDKKIEYKLPKATKQEPPNWQKWKNLFF